MVTIAFNRRRDEPGVLPGFVGRALRTARVKNPLLLRDRGAPARSPLAGLVRALRLNLALGATFVGAFELGKG